LIFSETAVRYALSHIDSVWYNDLIFFLIVIGSALLLVYRFRRYTPSKSLASFQIVAVGIYFIYRITESTWDFTSFSIWNGFKYADILIVTSICQLLLFVPKKNKTRENEINSFFDDQPLGFGGNDDLGYNSYAEILGKKILSSHFDKSFAIGINGKWGLGKTSFLDLLKRKVQSTDIIEVNFNVWNSHSSKAIIKDFFEAIQEAIQPYHSSLSRLMTQYSNKLVALNSNTFTQSIQTTVFAVSGFESINSLYQDINKALVSVNKKIVVYIDDLDRLDKHEIIEVIRLIRNTANFYNTFFIVAYDRNYVVNALKRHNPYKQEEFLEKIFQIELTLPYFNKDILRFKLAEKLKIKLPVGIHSSIDAEIIGTASSVPTFFNEWLESMRDVTRLANALILNLEKLNGEVEFVDFIRIELLRLKYPSAYELLFRRSFVFLETATGHHQKEYLLQLKSISSSDIDDLADNERSIRTLYELYLFRSYVELSIPKKEISKIVKFVDEIFSSNYPFGSHSRSHLSIVYPSKFNRYFTFALQEGVLSEIAFSNARSLSFKEFNSKITQWVSDGLEFELRNRFCEIKSFDSRDDFEKVIKAIFHLANLKTIKSNSFSQNLVGYDGKDLLDKIGTGEELVARYYLEADGKNTLKFFLKSLFVEAPIPYYFEAELIRYFNSHIFPEFVFEKEELKEICIGYLRNYCLEVDKLNNNVLHLFRSCEQTEWVPVGNSRFVKRTVIPNEAREIIIEFISTNDLDGFLLVIISIEPFERKTFAISKLVIDVFENWKNFECFLLQFDENEFLYLKEFKLFQKLNSSKSYSEHIDFTFKVIPIEDRIQNLI
jgi:hypothetical protein